MPARRSNCLRAGTARLLRVGRGLSAGPLRRLLPLTLHSDALA
jgi:hypothetical protein